MASAGGRADSPAEPAMRVGVTDIGGTSVEASSSLQWSSAHQHYGYWQLSASCVVSEVRRRQWNLRLLAARQ